MRVGMVDGCGAGWKEWEGECKGGVRGWKLMRECEGDACDGSVREAGGCRGNARGGVAWMSGMGECD